MSKTTEFKLYLNSILNTIDPKIHNELWNKLSGVIVENEGYKQQLAEKEAFFYANLEGSNNLVKSLQEQLAEKDKEIEKAYDRGFTAGRSKMSFKKLMNP